MNTAQAEAVANANAHLTNVGLPSYDDLLAALEAVAWWASDEGQLAGRGPMDVSEFARSAVANAKGVSA